MPLNPLDNMPEALRRQIGAGKVPCMSKEPQMNGNSSFGGCLTCSSSKPAEKDPISLSTLAKQGKVRLLINNKDQCTIIKFQNMVSLMIWLFLCASTPPTRPSKIKILVIITFLYIPFISDLLLFSLAKFGRVRNSNRFLFSLQIKSCYFFSYQHYTVSSL